MRKIISLLILASTLLTVHKTFAQEQVIDEVVAVVGANYILASEIETQYIQYREQGEVGNARAMRCRIFEDMLFQKLMLNQAELDSVQITDDQVNQTMDARFRYYIQQFGSQEKMEKFYKKSLLEIREDFRSIVKQQLMVDEVQQKLVKDVKVTPAEVRRMFNELPKDSIPIIEKDYQIGQIIKEPVISKEEMETTRERLKGLRDRIMKGESFNALAVLYSEDPGSSRRGGEVGFVSRGQLYPEYEAAAFALKKGEISDIIKTKAGYHIIQLIERRGEQINTRHILLMPKISDQEKNRVTKLLDSVAVLIRDKKLTFEEAALKFSDDPGKINGGLLINPGTGNARFTPEQLSKYNTDISNAIEKMKVGEVSRPIAMENEEGKQTLRILYLEDVTDAHQANLKEDYNAIQEWALNKKKAEAIDEWISNKIAKTYFKINPAYKDCKFMHNWEIK
ncbi:MAG: peptidylprolyl isomerase [Omnitrophica WOR_2 bacterium]|jgi:peptidyl-prolyl cis-trans isomerase SurA